MSPLTGAFHCRLQKCFHNRYAVSLMSKTDLLKIPEICDFFFVTNVILYHFSALSVLLCSGRVELKTDPMELCAH